MTDTDIVVILVNTLYSRNIGYSARAVANMGAQRLILIDPKCDLDYEARQGAAGGQMTLLETTTYKTWQEFYGNEPEGMRIAFCARKNSQCDQLDLRERLKSISSNLKQPIYLIFGPEDRGLSNEDLDLTNFIVNLPTYGSFSSMNISHAVMLALYLVQTHLKFDDQKTHNQPENFQFPEESLREWLHTLGFQTGERRTDAFKVLKRILLSNVATAKELRILEAVVNQTVRKLKN